MLLNVYSRGELDKIDDWIDNIQLGNKVMLGLNEDIQDTRARAQA